MGADLVCAIKMQNPKTPLSGPLAINQGSLENNRKYEFIHMNCRCEFIRTVGLNILKGQVWSLPPTDLKKPSIIQGWFLNLPLGCTFLILRPYLPGFFRMIRLVNET